MTTDHRPGRQSWLLAAMFLAARANAADAVQPPYQLLPLLEPRPGQTITLQVAVQRADQVNRSLAVARVDLETAAVKRLAAYATIFPSLYGTLDYALSAGATPSGNAMDARQFIARREISAGAVANLPLVRFWSWSDLTTAREEEEVAVLSVEQIRQELLYGVAETYFQAALLQRLIAVFQAQADALTHHVEAARARYRAGVGDLVDVKRAQTELVGVREEQVKALAAFEDSRDALAVLIASDQIPQPTTDPQLRHPPELSPPDAGQVHARRWDLLLSEQNSHLAEHRLAAEWLRLVPTLDATLQYAHIRPAQDLVGSTSRDVWFAGLVLSMPIFDYTIFPQLQTRRLAVKQARLRLAEKRAAVMDDLQRARRAVVEADQLVATARVKVGLADDALDLSQVNYINGLGSALSVVDARRVSQTAHVDLETRRFRLALARLFLSRSLGLDILEAI